MVIHLYQGQPILLRDFPNPQITSIEYWLYFGSNTPVWRQNVLDSDKMIPLIRLLILQIQQIPLQGDTD